jgi:hypothetical protein
MQPARRSHPLRLFAVALAVMFGAAVTARTQGECCLTMHDLERMSVCELEALFKSIELGTPFVGCGRGRQLCSTDPCRPRLKTFCANLAWKGKIAGPDGHIVNRWIGGVRAIETCYIIGPSWVDGRPAILMEYAPGTPILANTHDELREVAPGLYVGPLYDRFPCPVLRGYIAVEVACGSCRPELH